VPNANGARPFLDRNPAAPNESSFRHVDSVVERAAALGLYVALLPNWAD
jgi:hypothetical protein